MAELATRQHGVVARRQLIVLGVAGGTLDGWVAGGRLLVVHRGVYAVGHSALGREGRVMAAVLACGPGAVASHRSASRLWALRPDNRPAVEVTATGRRRGRRGIDVHATRDLDCRDRTIVAGIPVTTLPRTLLDLAEVVRADELRRAVEEGERLGLLDLRAIEDVMARAHGRHGLAPLRAALERASGPPPATRSELERRFTEAIRRAGLPLPSQNVLLAGHEVDALWAGARLVVELDGYAYHRTRRAFETDRGRDADLQLAGYRVVRLTDRMLRSGAGIRTVARLLAEATSGAQPRAAVGAAEAPPSA